MADILTNYEVFERYESRIRKHAMWGQTPIWTNTDIENLIETLRHVQAGVDAYRKTADALNEENVRLRNAIRNFVQVATFSQDSEGWMEITVRTEDFQPLRKAIAESPQ